MKLKQWQNIFQVTVNASSIVQHVIQIKNGIMKHVNVTVKMIECDEIVSVMDVISTKMTSALAANVTKNCHSKKVRDC